MAAHCSGCVFTVCVCVCVCVFTAVCVCTLDGLNAEHKFRVCHVTFSSTIHSKNNENVSYLGYLTFKYSNLVFI